MTLLHYGNTNTYFLNGLLIDTDMPETMPGLYKELKRNGIGLCDIRFVMATHYHPDHMGLISELTAHGIKHLLVDKQREYVGSSDHIFARQKNIRYQPIKEEGAAVISCKNSRSFLLQLGISGEILPTQSHSPDGVALLTDDGSCFVGDLEPPSYIDAYKENPLLKKDWENIMSYHPKKIFFGHINSVTI